MTSEEDTNPIKSRWRHDMALLALCEGNPPVTGGLPLQRASNTGLRFFLWCYPQQTNEQTIEWRVTVTSLLCYNFLTWIAATMVRMKTTITGEMTSTSPMTRAFTTMFWVLDWTDLEERDGEWGAGAFNITTLKPKIHRFHEIVVAAWMRWKVSEWQFPVQSMTKISSKW